MIKNANKEEPVMSKAQQNFIKYVGQDWDYINLLPGQGADLLCVNVNGEWCRCSPDGGFSFSRKA